MKYLIFGVIILLLCGLYYLILAKPAESTVINKTENYAVQKIYYTRDMVNDSISRKIKTGQFNDVIEIYSTVCKDPEIISLIVFKCLEKDIPVNLGMALVEQESGFNPKALNVQKTFDNEGREKIVSKDIGLWQTNTRTFKKYKEADLWNIRINNELGAQHFIDKYREHGSWEEAAMRYNGWGDKSVKHLAAVLKRERDIDRLYNSY
jgi:hypothetical protein